MWCAIVSENATPTATLSPCVSPADAVIAEAVCSARSSTSPLTLSGVPMPSQACVVTFEMTIAMPGAMLSPPPLAPVFAIVLSACVVVACSATSSPPVRRPVMEARVVSSMTATTTDAPTPTLDAPLTPPFEGSALFVATVLDVAVSVTSALGPVPAWSVPASDAVVSMFSMSIATEPATPTEPPPAPLVALAPSSCVEAMSAAIVAPVAVTIAPAGRIASLRIFA